MIPPPSAAALARRPLLTPGPALAALLVALAVVIVGVEWLAVHELGAFVATGLHIAVFFVAYDLATGAALLVAARRRLAADRDAARQEGPETPPPVSIMIAAYNEAAGGRDHGIVATVRALTAQVGVTMEILVGDDGSEDATFDEVVRAFGLEAAEGADGEHRGVLEGASGSVALRVFRFPHAGKGATLNALAVHASHTVLITMDADTSPAEGAIGHLAVAFLDPAVESAAGVVSVRNARSLLTRHQFAEYVKNSIVRIGWSALGALEQVPGAFAGVRAESFRAVGGFPTDSLTEDYELTYRLVERGVALGRVPVVVTVPRAQAFTDVPVTVRGFVRQRTRWFAGFLSTLFRFKHLIGRPAAGGFGIVRLPLKIVDAVLPLIAFASLIAILRGTASPILSISRFAAGIFVLRWLWDLFFYGAALRLSEQLGDPAHTARLAPESWRGWLYTSLEALTYVWLKHASTLRAYTWAIRRARTWEPSREPSREPSLEPSHEPGREASPGPSREPSRAHPLPGGAMVGSPQCAPPSVQP